MSPVNSLGQHAASFDTHSTVWYCIFKAVETKLQHQFCILLGAICKSKSRCLKFLLGKKVTCYKMHYNHHAMLACLNVLQSEKKSYPFVVSYPGNLSRFSLMRMSVRFGGAIWAHEPLCILYNLQTIRGRALCSLVFGLEDHCDLKRWALIQHVGNHPPPVPFQTNTFMIAVKQQLRRYASNWRQSVGFFHCTACQRFCCFCTLVAALFFNISEIIRSLFMSLKEKRKKRKKMKEIRLDRNTQVKLNLSSFPNILVQKQLRNQQSKGIPFYVHCCPCFFFFCYWKSRKCFATVWPLALPVNSISPTRLMAVLGSENRRHVRRPVKTV